eukprot:jgi/Botrbrau1/665/Bobra.0161s0049.2
MAHFPAGIDIFILAGQSNMAGRGGICRHSDGNKVWDGFLPAEARPHEGVFMLSLDQSWVIAEEPMHKDFDKKACGVGPGLVFARALLHDQDVGSPRSCTEECNQSVQSAGRSCWEPPGLCGTKARPFSGPIGLVPCAFGGSSVSQWQPGQPLYSRLENRTVAAMSAPGACLRALLWYQGESDCDTEENASLYASRFATFLNAYRWPSQRA